MKKFIIEDDFWSIFPSAKIGVIVCHGIDNTIKDKETYREMILYAEEEALKYLQNTEFSSNQVVKVWREAFQKFKTKMEVLENALENLEKNIEDKLGGTCKVSILDINNREISLL